MALDDIVKRLGAKVSDTLCLADHFTYGVRVGWKMKDMDSLNPTEKGFLRWIANGEATKPAKIGFYMGMIRDPAEFISTGYDMVKNGTGAFGKVLDSAGDALDDFLDGLEHGQNMYFIFQEKDYYASSNVDTSKFNVEFKTHPSVDYLQEISEGNVSRAGQLGFKTGYAIACRNGNRKEDK